MKIKNFGDSFIEREAYYDDVDDRFVIKSTQDVEPILRSNIDEQNDSNNGFTPSRDMRKIAEIPLVVVEQWLKDGVNIFDKNHEKEVKRRLRSSEWRHLKTCSGNI